MKYKLLKKYPNLPVDWKVGMEVEKCPSSFNYIPSYKGYKDKNLFIYDVENSPEFWEKVVEYKIGTKVINSQTNCIYTRKEDGWYKNPEKTSYTDDMITKSNYINLIEDKVVEKDYEILSFYNKEGKCYYNLKRNNYYFSELASSRSLEYCMSFYQITSVKRLSDGEIFTVGDKVNGSCAFGKISVIAICANGKIMFHIDTHENSVWMSGAKKSKQPLFTTEDGVDIFEDNQYFRVWKKHLETDDYNTYAKSVYNFKEVNKNAFHFSTKEKAEDYILNNKPCLSVKDVMNAGYGICNPQTLLKIVKEKHGS